MKFKKAKKEKEGSRSLVPWRPFEELERLPSLFGNWPFPSRQMPRLSDQLFRESPWAGQAGAVLPAMDVSENDEHYAITVELPGARKDDVHVELEEGMLTVRGEKSSEREEKKEQSCYVERCYGSFSRSMRLPADADADHLDASFKDGVLSITIPKTEEAKPHSIAIKAA